MALQHAPSAMLCRMGDANSPHPEPEDPSTPDRGVRALEISVARKKREEEGPAVSVQVRGCGAAHLRLTAGWSFGSRESWPLRVAYARVGSRQRVWQRLGDAKRKGAQMQLRSAGVIP